MRLKLAPLILLTLLGNSAFADDYSVGNLHIGQPWSRALPPNVPTGAAYFTVHNGGNEDDRLIGASTPRAGRAELHTHVHLGDVMKMQKIDSVAIPASAEVRFEPGGNHVMLFNLTRPLVAGEHFPLTLEFEKAGQVELSVTIKTEAPQTGHHH
ncbi:MAG: copper chaperone PCu(A)C [Pseudomonas sp.]|nr:MAG: copper chaperone PCu(A)C [Pseudomonas sp.]